jgi:ADP-ribose pyrophosphatase YjhB (NUDIX family)
MSMQRQNIPRVFCPYCGTRFADGISIDAPQLPCVACGLVDQPRRTGPAVLVLTIVFAEDQILLIKRGLPPYCGFWAPPGGYVEPGESLESAAAREVNEEVGVSLLPDQLIPHTIASLPALNQIYVIFLAVLDRVVSLRPELPEVLDAGWFSEHTYPRDEIWPPGKGFDMGRVFERVRTGRVDFYQLSADWMRVISNSDGKVVYLWRR